MKINKQKIFEILLTALLSAGIAILQNVLTSLIGHSEIKASPEVAGGIGLAIKSVQNFRIS